MPPLRITAAIRRQCIPTPLVYRSRNPEGTRPDLIVQTSIRVEIALIRLLIIGRLPRAMRFQSPGLPSRMAPLLPPSDFFTQNHNSISSPDVRSSSPHTTISYYPIRTTLPLGQTSSLEAAAAQDSDNSCTTSCTSPRCCERTR